MWWLFSPFVDQLFDIIIVRCLQILVFSLTESPKHKDIQFTVMPQTERGTDEHIVGFGLLMWADIKYNNKT